MPLFFLTEEKIAELQEKLDSKQEELAIVECTSETDQWRSELEEVLEIYEGLTKGKQEHLEAVAAGKVITKSTKKTTKRTTKKSIDI
jgi:hypothetical protein